VASQVVSYALDADTVVQFEVEPTSEWRQVRADQVAGHVDEATRPAVEAVTFGIKVSGTANWLIAKAASEANFGVKLVWRPQPQPDDNSDANGDGASA
jgi:hypothetical protein